MWKYEDNCFWILRISIQSRFIGLLRQNFEKFALKVARKNYFTPIYIS